MFIQENCKCGSKAHAPTKVKGLKDGFVIKCSNARCPAKVQRVGKESCIERWNEMATEF